MTTPSEHLEQITLVNELRKRYPLTHAISNGGYRTKTTAKRLKDEGVLAGVPDLFIPELALYIELKRTKGGRLSPQQKVFIESLKNTPCHAIIAYGYQDAITQIEIFLKSPR